MEKAPADSPERSGPQALDLGRPEGTASVDPLATRDANRTLLTLLYFVIVATSAWHVLRNYNYVVDDTFINLRYAKHFVEGQGLVFNPGERVEGYTNITMVLLAAALLKLHANPIVGLKAITALMAVWTLWLTAKLEREVGGPSSPTIVPLSVLLLLSAGAFVYWALCPMGTMVFTGLFIAALVLMLREHATGRWRGAGFVFAALAITRPEGIFLFGVSTAAFLMVDYVGRHDWQCGKRYIANVAVFALLFGGYTLWRLHYFGDLLPNTYYAKVTGGVGRIATGAVYLRDWLFAFPVLGAALALPVLASSWRVRQRMQRPLLLAALASVALAYAVAVVGVGGDFMPFFRFFVPLMPPCAVVMAAVFRRLPLPRKAQGPVVVLMFALHLTCSMVTEQPYRAFVAHRTAVLGRLAGEWLAERLSGDGLIAVNTAGSLPYYSGLPAIDMLGLTDARIARRPVYIVSTGWAGHRRGWGAYVFRRRPQVILWYNSVGAAEPFYLSDHELAANPLFRFFYRLKTIRLPALAEGHGAIARFIGFPFGFTPGGTAFMEDLGLRATFHRGLVNLTTFFEGPIRLTYFEFDARDAPLWEDGQRLRGNLRAFVDHVAARWAEHGAQQPGGNEVARAAVTAMCADAYRAISEGNYGRAGEILEAALQRNRDVRSPLVYQYLANLSVITGHLLTAVAAQKEALRLEPRSGLYRDNLHHLLTVPYEDFRERAGAVSRPAPPTAPKQPLAISP